MAKKARDRGIRGEDQAVLFLRSQGYQIITRNYRWRGGEIDIIARDGDSLVFIEVKSRSSTSHGLPEESLTAQKREKLVRTAMKYSQEHPTPLNLRFDVVALLPGSAKLIKDAFGGEG